MSQQALYRKWRSGSFDELVGQPHVVQTLQNALDSDRVAHAYIFSGPRGTGKCVKFDTLIVNPLTGALQTIESLYQEEQASLLTLDNDYKLRPTSPVDFVDDGIKPCVRVTTALGRQIEVTLSHPFLTIHGWKRLADLEVGIRIAVPRILPVNGTFEMPDFQVRLLAHLLAEGTVSTTKIGFTSSEALLAADFCSAALEFDNIKVVTYPDEERTPTYWVHQEELQNHINQPSQSKNSIVGFVKELGLAGKRAAEKFIPSIVFELSRDSLCLFLRTLFSGDGGVDSSSTPTISYYSSSQTLIAQVQHLLLRFGIIAKIRYKPAKYKDTLREAWALEITHRDSLDCFIAEIGFIGKKAQRLHKLVAKLEGRIRNPNKDVIPAEIYNLVCSEKAKSNKSWVDVGRALGYKHPKKAYPTFKDSPSRRKLAVYGEVIGSQEICNLANSDLYWDEIVSIEYSGEYQVYDLTISKTHNFVANDFIVHNTSSARILAKAVNCVASPEQRPCNQCHICLSINDGSSLDLIEIDAASNTQVDKVREAIVERIQFTPSEFLKKVYIIDEVHMLSNSAFNALLKTIEEPPPHAMFILATTEIHKIPATILSRCQRLDFRRITLQEIADHLEWVLQQEGLTAEREVLELVGRQATGSMRDALSLLDQLLAHGGTHLTLAQARRALGLASLEAVQGLVDYLLAQDITSSLLLVNKLIEGGAEPRQFVVEILDYLRALLLTRAGGGRQLINLPESTREHLRGQAKYANAAVLIQIIRTFNQAGADLKLGLQPQLPLELAIVETVLALQERGQEPAAPPKEQLADIITRPSANVTVQRTTPSQKPRDKEPKAAQARRRRVDNKQEEAIVPPISPSMLNFAPPPPPVQAPPPSPKPTVSSPPPTPTYHTFDWWRDNWEEFKAFLVKQGEDGYRVSVRLKANLCQLHAVEEDKLTLRFFYSINFNLVNTPLEKKVLQQALTEFSRTPMKVYLVVIPKEQPSTRQGASQTKYQKAAEDPVVQAALKYGGRIIEVYPPNRQN